MTIKEIAQKLGVSISAVSLVLNDKPGVRRESRERITRELVSNGYTIRTAPKAAAQSGDFTFIYYKDSNHRPERNADFFAGIIGAIESRARAAGYGLSLMHTDRTSLPETLASLHMQGNCAGILFFGTEFDAANAYLLEQCTLPLVCIDNRLMYHEVNTVTNNNIEGTYQAVKYLYDKGHRRIGHLKSAFPGGGIPEREEGYYRAMAALGLTVDERAIATVDHMYDEAMSLMQRYLEGHPELPTAFFAANDVIAAGCQRALQEMGIRVPEDISIIGFDNSSISTLASPALTTVHIDCGRMGEMAVDRVLELIRHPAQPAIKCEVGTVLVERNSVANCILAE